MSDNVAIDTLGTRGLHPFLFVFFFFLPFATALRGQKIEMHVPVCAVHLGQTGLECCQFTGLGTLCVMRLSRCHWGAGQDRYHVVFALQTGLCRR